MDRDGRNKVDLTKTSNEFAYGFSSSRDGKRIAYHKSYQVYLADADGSNAVHVKTGNPFNFVPTWSPDGKTPSYFHRALRLNVNNRSQQSEPLRPYRSAGRILRTIAHCKSVQSNPSAAVFAAESLLNPLTPNLLISEAMRLSPLQGMANRVRNTRNGSDS
jgi:hypothetical protein